MIDEKLASELNKQINAELYSSYLYLSTAAYFDALSLRGFSTWMKVQAEEELGRAMKIFNYLSQRSGRIILGPTHRVGEPQARRRGPPQAREEGDRDDQQPRSAGEAAQRLRGRGVPPLIRRGAGRGRDVSPGAARHAEPRGRPRPLAAHDRQAPSREEAQVPRLAGGAGQR